MQTFETAVLIINALQISRSRIRQVGLATASHGVLDALTDGGLGVAFFSPFDNTRYFFPWRPLEVSPISITRFFSEGGGEVLRSEFKFVWLPLSSLWLAVWAARRVIKLTRASAP